MDASGLGLVLLAAGLLAWLSARMLGRREPRRIPAPPAAEPIPEDHGSARMIVEPGGRIGYISAAAREIFQLLPDQPPNLENLSRLLHPSERFLELCAEDGEAGFALGRELIAVQSYRLPAHPAPLRVLHLQTIDLIADPAGLEPGNTSPALKTITEISQTFSAAHDLEGTLLAIMSTVAALVPADLIEISIRDEEAGSLQPYWHDPAGQDRDNILLAARTRPGEGYTGFVAQERQPLMVADADANSDLPCGIRIGAVPLQSYLGIPLQVGGELVGTLALGSMTGGAFQQQDQDLLELLSVQAALAVFNAHLSQKQQRRAVELSGLMALMQTLGTLQDPSAVITQVVQKIAPLFPFSMLGFLAYDEGQGALQAQNPFHGLPAQIVELYQTELEPDSPGRKMIEDQQVIRCEQAAGDPRWEMLGLGDVAQAASMRDTILVPLVSGGHLLGYFQASNHHFGPSAISQDEVRLLQLAASQAAPALENASLAQREKQRSQHEIALKRIAGSLDSAEPLDEVLNFSLQQLAQLLDARTAAFYLLDSDCSKLNLQAAYDVDTSQTESLEEILLLDSRSFTQTAAGSCRSILLSSASLPQDHPAAFYLPYIDSQKVESALLTPLIVDGKGIGELWLLGQEGSVFQQAALTTSERAARMLAGRMQRESLAKQTDSGLQQEVDYLRAMMHTTRALGGAADLKELLSLAHDEALRLSGADSGAIVLFALDVLQGQGPEPGLFVGDLSVEELAKLEGGAQGNAVLDVQQLESQMMEDQAAQNGSLYLLRVHYQKRLAGLVRLVSSQEDHFNPLRKAAVVTLIQQLEMEIERLLQFEERTQRGILFRRELEALENLFQVSQSMLQFQSLEDTLDVIATAIRKTTNFQVVLISVYEGQRKALRRISAAGLPHHAWEFIRTHTQPWRSVERLLEDAQQMGVAYFIPAEGQSGSADDGEQARREESEEIWDPQDTLIVPLVDLNGEPLGVISVDLPADERHPDRLMLESLELFAALTRLMIEIHSRFNAIGERTQKLESEQEQITQEAVNAKESQQTLLKSEQERVFALQEMNRQMVQLHFSLEVAELTSRQPDIPTALQTLTTELLERFGMQTGLIARKVDGQTEPYLAAVSGELPTDASPEAFFGQRNPLREVLLSGKVLLVDDLDADSTWEDCPMLRSLDAKCLICLPLETGGGQAAILAVGTEAQLPFGEAGAQLYAQLAHQVSIGLQNLQLLNETRHHLEEVNILFDFSRSLGNLAPDEILQLLVESVEQAAPAAEAAWVGLFDSQSSRLTPVHTVGCADPQSLLAISFEAAPEGEKSPLPLRVALSGKAARVGEIQFAQDYRLPPDDLLLYKRAVADRLPISSLCVPLSLGENVLGVMVVDNFSLPQAFNPEDEALVFSLAQQAALALENSRLYQAVETRAGQLQALTQAAGSMAASLDSDGLIAPLLDHLGSVLPYETATLWLREEDQLQIAAASGFDDDESRVNLTVDIEDSILFQEIQRTGEAIYVEDVRQDERFSGLFVPENLCWLGIPLLAQSELSGMIALEKQEPAFYTAEHIHAARTFASQAAITLENARLYEDSTLRAAELDLRSQRLAMLNRFSREIGSSLEAHHIYQKTIRHLSDAFEAAYVSLILFDDQGRLVLQTEEPRVAAVLPQVLSQDLLLGHLRESGASFTTDNIAAEAIFAPLMERFFIPRQVKSLLAAPLTSGDIVIGWVWLQTVETYHFSTSEIELAQTVASQAGIAIQHARLFAETDRLKVSLALRVEKRTAALRREYQNTRALLRIITELSGNLNTREVIADALEIANEAVGAEQGLILMSGRGEQAYQAGMELYGIQPPGMEAPNQPEQEIVSWVLYHRKMVLLEDTEADVTWFTEIEPPAYRSLVVVPLMLGEEAQGTLFFFHRLPGIFKEEQQRLIEAAARQFSIALHNAALFYLAREQADTLSTMLRNEQTILESIVDGVVVTNASNVISTFNASAERILGLSVMQVMGQSLGHFAGIFGEAAHEWMQTIQEWSQNPSAYQIGETYSTRLELDGGHILSIQLAPVIWGSEFLGTVSIFRDITHEVQIDRLKSEFVANVSHELRTPITSIKGYVELLLMGAGGDLNEQQGQFLNIVNTNTDRLTVLVNDLLDISRIEAGQIDLVVEALDLGELVEEVLEEVRRHSRDDSKPMRFLVNKPPDLPPVRGDALRIRQVLNNLISNAYHYTPANGKVDITLVMAGSAVQVDIQDNGIGIDPNQHYRVFERFYRGEDPLVLATAGTGLGLAISKTFIDMHEGRIWFSSSGVRGEGCTFSFALPLYDNQESKEELQFNQEE